MLIAGCNTETYRMLKAMGVPNIEQLKKAVITFEVERIVTVDVEYFASFDPDETNTFFREFELSVSEKPKLT